MRRRSRQTAGEQISASSGEAEVTPDNVRSLQSAEETISIPRRSPRLAHSTATEVAASAQPSHSNDPTDAATAANYSVDESVGSDTDGTAAITGHLRRSRGRRSHTSANDSSEANCPFSDTLIAEEINSVVSSDAAEVANSVTSSETAGGASTRRGSNRRLDFQTSKTPKTAQRVASTVEEMSSQDDLPEISGQDFVRMFLEECVFRFMGADDLGEWLDVLLRAGEPTASLQDLVTGNKNKICGRLFTKDEIAYTCKTCRNDPTCVICQSCFQRGNHDGHDVLFIKTSQGGSCDCGDREAWRPKGFCSDHPGASDGDRDRAIASLPQSFQDYAPVVIDAITAYLHEALIALRTFHMVADLGSVAYAEVERHPISKPDVFRNQITFSENARARNPPATQPHHPRHHHHHMHHHHHNHHHGFGDESDDMVDDEDDGEFQEYGVILDDGTVSFEDEDDEEDLWTDRDRTTGQSWRRGENRNNLGRPGGETNRPARSVASAYFPSDFFFSEDDSDDEDDDDEEDDDEREEEDEFDIFDEEEQKQGEEDANNLDDGRTQDGVAPEQRGAQGIRDRRDAGDWLFRDIQAPGNARGQSRFRTRLMNDDIHTLDEIIHAFAVTTGKSHHKAMRLTSRLDRDGVVTAQTGSILRCVAVSSELKKHNLVPQISPLWANRMEERCETLIKWLHSISNLSEGCAALVIKSLCAQKVKHYARPSFAENFRRGADAQDGGEEGQSTCRSDDFLKRCTPAMNSSARRRMALFIDCRWHKLKNLLEASSSLSVIGRAMKDHSPNFAKHLRHKSSRESDMDVDEGKRSDRDLSSAPTTSSSHGESKSGTESPVSAVGRAWEERSSEVEGMQGFLLANFLCLMKLCLESDLDARNLDVTGESLNKIIDRALELDAELKRLQESSLLSLLVYSDAYLPKPLGEAVGTLEQTLLVDSYFKAELGQAYTQHLPTITKLYSQGLGSGRASVFELSVQFMTVPTLVRTLALPSSHCATPGDVQLIKLPDCSEQRRADYFLTLMQSLYEVIKPACTDSLPHTLILDRPLIIHERYKHCLENFEYVLHVRDLAEYIWTRPDVMDLWLSCLGFAQRMDEQERRTAQQPHVEYESDSWFTAYSFVIMVHGVLMHMLKGLRKGTALDTVKATTSKILSWGRERASSITTANKYKKSLHLPLHRFLIAIIRQILQSPWSSEVYPGILSYLAGLGEDGYLLVESPLHSLVMAGQIQANMWRRHGEEAMSAQLWNYRTLPHSLFLRDADIHFLQLGAMLYGPETMLSKIIEGFGLSNVFHTNPKPRKVLPGVFSTNPPEPDYTVNLAEEFLEVLLVTVMDIPRENKVFPTPSDEVLRVEMLHQLCVKSKQYSELVEAAGALQLGQESLCHESLEKVLKSLATYKPPEGMEPGRYDLRPECFLEYNPYFPHLSREEHEQARDRAFTALQSLRQSTKKSIAPLQPIQPLFKEYSVVMNMLLTPGAIEIAWKVLYHTLAPKKEDERGIILASERLVSHVLNMLVLGVQACTQSTIDSSSSSAASTSRPTSLSSCALKYLGLWVQKPLPSYVPSQADSKLKDASLLTLLVLLRDLPVKEKSLQEQQESANWLIHKVAESDQRCRSVVKDYEKAHELSAGVSKSAANTHHAKSSAKKAAQEAKARAMAAIAQKQKAFAAMMASSMTSDEEGGATGASSDRTAADGVMSSEVNSIENGPNGAVNRGHSTKKGKKRALGANEKSLSKEDHKKRKTGVVPNLRQAKTAVKDAPCECILCHEGLTAERPGGFIAYAQRSTVLSGIYRPDPAEALGKPGAKARSHFASHFRNLSNHKPEYSCSINLDGPILGSASGPSSGTSNAPQPTGSEEHSEEDASSDTAPRYTFVADGGEGGDSVVRVRVHNLDTDDIHWDGPLDLDSRIDDLVTMKRIDETRNWGVHTYTCRHALHYQCFVEYLDNLSHRASSGEDFEGMSAIDQQAYLNEFLCPLCKSIGNLLIPTVSEGEETDLWIVGEENDASRSSEMDGTSALVEGFQMLAGDDWTDCTSLTTAQHRSSRRDNGTSRPEDRLNGSNQQTVMATDVLNRMEHVSVANQSVMSAAYARWASRHSCSKGKLPFMWASVAYTLTCVEADANSSAVDASSLEAPVWSHQWLKSVERELPSLSSLVKFCRWRKICGAALRNDVIQHVFNLCCPLLSYTRRAKQKIVGTFDLASVPDTFCYLLAIDLFPGLFIASVMAKDLEYVRQIFSLYFKVQYLRSIRNAIEHFLALQANVAKPSQESGESSRGRRKGSSKRKSSSGVVGRSTGTKRKIVSNTSGGRAATPQSHLKTNVELSSKNRTAIAKLVELILSRRQGEESTDIDIHSVYNFVLEESVPFFRKAALLWRSLVLAADPHMPESQAMSAIPPIPSFYDVAALSERRKNDVLDWCSLRERANLLPAETCALEAAFFSQQNTLGLPLALRQPRLIELPKQFYQLYGCLSGRRCTQCMLSPNEPALCLICGEFLCAGGACCRSSYGSKFVGECTRHSAECGGGVGMILILKQCRVYLIRGRLAAQAPSPYVDAHGEEDGGLQRGCPLQLSEQRYEILTQLWRRHRIAAEVSRSRNNSDLVAPPLVGYF